MRAQKLGVSRWHATSCATIGPESCLGETKFPLPYGGKFWVAQPRHPGFFSLRNVWGRWNIGIIENSQILDMYVKPSLHISPNISVITPSFKNLYDTFLIGWPEIIGHLAKKLSLRFLKDGLSNRLIGTNV